MSPGKPCENKTWGIHSTDIQDYPFTTIAAQLLTFLSAHVECITNFSSPLETTSTAVRSAFSGRDVQLHRQDTVRHSSDFLTKLCAGNSSSMFANIAKGARMRSAFVRPGGRSCRAAAKDARVESDCSATAFIIKARRTSPCSWPPPVGGGDLSRIWNGRHRDLMVCVPCGCNNNI